MKSKNHIFSDVAFLTLKEHANDSLSVYKFPWKDLSSYGKHRYVRYITRHKEPTLCFQIDMDEGHCSTNYMIGVDWIEEQEAAIQVVPKLTKEGRKINYSKMLMDALNEPENYSHLDDLLVIDFNRPYIPLLNSEDTLSPFLVALFLKMVKRIVSKGLKRSYYLVNDNLECKVRGRIMVNEQLRKNIFTGRMTKNYCCYQDYGPDIPENRLLAKAILYCSHLLNKRHIGFNVEKLQNMLQYVSPAFQHISPIISINEIQRIKVSPLYAEYRDAVKYAKLILKRFSYNISEIQGERVMTPPYWIDMTKLFELYVFKKLREAFSPKEVKYHFKAHYRELDFVLHSNDGNIVSVIDTKYKPRYHDHSADIDDLRQVAGYARLEKVYQELKIDDYNKNIDCLIIYAHQTCKDDLLELKQGIDRLRKANGYVNMYLMGISLPEEV